MKTLAVALKAVAAVAAFCKTAGKADVSQVARALEFCLNDTPYMELGVGYGAHVERNAANDVGETWRAGLLDPLQFEKQAAFDKVRQLAEKLNVQADELRARWTLIQDARIEQARLAGLVEWKDREIDGLRQQLRLANEKVNILSRADVLTAV